MVETVGGAEEEEGEDTEVGDSVIVVVVVIVIAVEGEEQGDEGKDPEKVGVCSKKERCCLLAPGLNF